MGLRIGNKEQNKRLTLNVCATEFKDLWNDNNIQQEIPTTQPNTTNIVEKYFPYI